MSSNFSFVVILHSLKMFQIQKDHLRFFVIYLPKIFLAKQYKKLIFLPFKKIQGFEKIKNATTLCLLGQGASGVKRGSRPSSSDVKQKFQNKKKGPAQVLPVKEVRLDGMQHWPVWVEKQIRCKFPNCKGYSQIICEKCGTALCFTKKKNCFRNFHQQFILCFVMGLFFIA